MGTHLEVSVAYGVVLGIEHLGKLAVFVDENKHAFTENHNLHGCFHLLSASSYFQGEGKPAISLAIDNTDDSPNPAIIVYAPSTYQVFDFFSGTVNLSASVMEQNMEPEILEDIEMDVFLKLARIDLTPGPVIWAEIA